MCELHNTKEIILPSLSGFKNSEHIGHASRKGRRIFNNGIITAVMNNDKIDFITEELLKTIKNMQSYAVNAKKRDISRRGEERNNAIFKVAAIYVAMNQ